ncbi:hypothetical protein phytr_1730 [Candidatus Phycorickettsia trachydisci]|uniref:Uncharacterized protein n=1 Tax=Candidatus Phycorickettsia trachydisci TaxID=2115978 RepID=A0A2P1P782_9RICK|nr:hypothetical protein [Candidatus Phycorickettsia trachydisci]AVP87131.1 hypothetical protein phytr_1730 [Candidatus Phycorickettsia trachydisci]
MNYLLNEPMVILTVFCIITINVYAVMQIFKLQDIVRQKDQQLWNQQLDMQLFVKIMNLANSDLNKLVSLLKGYTKASSIVIYNSLTKDFNFLDGEGDLKNYIIANCLHILEDGFNNQVLDIENASLLFTRAGENVIIFKFDSKVCMKESTLDIIKAALGFAGNSNGAICY